MTQIGWALHAMHECALNGHAENLKSSAGGLIRADDESVSLSESYRILVNRESNGSKRDPATDREPAGASRRERRNSRIRSGAEMFR
jgi:hypothetical protein